MKLRSILSLVTAIVSVGVLAGCHETRTVIIHEQAPAPVPQQMNQGGYDGDYQDMDYPPVQPQVVYTNYYGSPQYGYWSGGYYHFYNPYGMAAIQTNSYLLSAGINGLAAYIGTRAALHSAWSVANPSGYHVVHHTSTRYIVRGKNGKTQYISKSEANRRAAQSRRDRKAYKVKRKQQQKAQRAKARKQQQMRRKVNKIRNQQRKAQRRSNSWGQSKFNNKSRYSSNSGHGVNHKRVYPTTHKYNSHSSHRSSSHRSSYKRH